MFEVQAAAVPRIDLVLLYSKEQGQSSGQQEALSALTGTLKGWVKEWPKVRLMCH